MSRTPLALIAAAAAVALPGAMPAQAVTTTKLNATVGPGFTISLTKGGAKVANLKAGVYELAVSDQSNIHDFHLTGPGLSWTFTSVPFKGRKTIVLSLLPGSYRYVCDPHASLMKGSFKVT